MKKIDIGYTSMQGSSTNSWDWYLVPPEARKCREALHELTDVRWANMHERNGNQWTSNRPPDSPQRDPGWTFG